MQVIIVVGNLEGGGAQRVALETVKQLDRTRFKPFLALFERGGAYETQVPEDVEILDWSGVGAWPTLIRWRNTIAAMCSRLRPDLMHAHSISPNRTLLRGIIANSRVSKRIPVLITEHNNLTLNNRRIRNRVRRWLITAEVRALYPRADLMTTVSAGVRDDLRRYVSDEALPKRVVYNPIDIEAIERASQQGHAIPKDLLPEKGRTCLVGMGRLVEQKGWFDLLRAFRIIRDRVEARLVILGEGPLRSEIEGRVDQLGLSGDVDLPGFLSNPWAVIRRCDLFVSASHWEGFFLAGVEAMACGVPVVVTDCDFGPREIISSEKDGILVPVGRPRALAEAALRVLGDRDLATRLVSTARETARRFDARAVVAEFEQIYQNLTGGHRAIRSEQ